MFLKMPSEETSCYSTHVFDTGQLTVLFYCSSLVHPLIAHLGLERVVQQNTVGFSYTATRDALWSRTTLMSAMLRGFKLPSHQFLVQMVHTGICLLLRTCFHVNICLCLLLVLPQFQDWPSKTIYGAERTNVSRKLESILHTILTVAEKTKVSKKMQMYCMVWEYLPISPCAYLMSAMLRRCQASNLLFSVFK